ncbi:hypothetical protein NGB23_04350 [Staphylococcus xylosus]|uniref:Protein-export membrane protein SecG n=2 Tax=Staphylococcus xylosus TaxID=1288 RepID=A0A418I4Y2_STAXY|nr:hypothetical protein [Staphylococcus xylosus]AID02459.1 hypothetical protein BE24_10670 [Staphylococcus xylosus]AID41717.1 hypothetical protein SXYLSMQ121_0285 [Staphylococcus xylosus]ARD75588.1 hypothetical protein AWC37_10790 [Staphylococcus xylosus]KTW24416.1 hypothetical protein NS341_01205 [Staphylococcus xylosus]MBE6180133.1 hypothetical protein [Staphylococcus xylosus]
MVFVALILFILSLVLLIYSITLLMGKDGTLFSLFTKKENELKKSQKLTIYITTIVLLVSSLVWFLNII